MKDTELRGLILNLLYEKRREGLITLKEDYFNGTVEKSEITRISEQLVEYELIRCKITRREDGRAIMGQAMITAKGVDVVEETVVPPITIKLDTPMPVQQTFNIHGGSINNSQLGNENIQNIQINNQELEKLYTAIDNTTLALEEKEEVKSLVIKAMENPMLNTVIAGIISNLDKLKDNAIVGYIKTVLAPLM